MDLYAMALDGMRLLVLVALVALLGSFAVVIYTNRRL